MLDRIVAWLSLRIFKVLEAAALMAMFGATFSLKLLILEDKEERASSMERVWDSRRDILMDGTGLWG